MEDQATEHGRPMTLGDLQTKKENEKAKDPLREQRRSASQENLVLVRDE